MLYKIKVWPTHKISQVGHLHLLYKIKPWDLSKNSPEISWNLTKEIKASFQNPSGVLQISRPWHLSTKSKPIGVGKKGFQGNYSLQNQGQSFPLTIPHLYRIKIWRYDIDEHVFTTKSRTCILHLTSLYKIKTHRCWEKGVSGELFSTESRSFPLPIPHLYRIKIWRYDIDEHAFTTKSKTFSKISSLPKM